MVSRQIVRHPSGRAALAALLSIMVLGVLGSVALRPLRFSQRSSASEAQPTDSTSNAMPTGADESSWAVRRIAHETQPPVVQAFPKEMVLLGPGRISIGQTGRRTNQTLKPGIDTEISVGRFAISKYEVSFAQYREYVEATHLNGPQPWDGISNYSMYAEIPINQITREQAENYCYWRYPSGHSSLKSGRLPSADEWIFAARSGRSDYRYPWGQQMEHARVNWHRTPQENLALVDIRSLPAGQSAQGVFHLIGNVAEWIGKSSTVHSLGLDRGVICGGSAFSNDLAELTATCRYRSTLRAYHDVGFRCVIEPISQ